MLRIIKISCSHFSIPRETSNHFLPLPVLRALSLTLFIPVTRVFNLNLHCSPVESSPPLFFISFAISSHLAFWVLNLALLNGISFTNERRSFVWASSQIPASQIHKFANHQHQKVQSLTLYFCELPQFSRLQCLLNAFGVYIGTNAHKS